MTNMLVTRWAAGRRREAGDQDTCENAASGEMRVYGSISVSVMEHRK
jgi:hypothetical protein